MVRDKLFKPPQSPGDPNAFRWRGGEISRIEAFSDAVFAFAITLLVVSLEVPHSFSELLDAMKGFPAFAICFFLILQVWHAHYSYFRRYGLEDRFTMGLNGVLLFVVLFFVYPLKFVFTLLAGQFFPFLHAQVPAIQLHQWPTLMVVYGLGSIAVYGCFALLYLHAWKLRDHLHLNALERHDTWDSISRQLVLVGVSAISVVLALAGSGSRAGMAYLSLGPLMTIHGFWMGRRRARLEK
jgi:uncharacterized membrane protein